MNASMTARGCLEDTVRYGERMLEHVGNVGQEVVLNVLKDVRKALELLDAPIPIRLECPACGDLHVDEGEFATRPHHTHACQHCGAVWRPAVVPTVGVRFLPGFKNVAPEASDDE